MNLNHNTPTNRAMNDPIITPDKIVRLQDSGIAYKELMRYTREIAETSAAITLNLFEEMKGGVMDRVGIICMLSELFVQQHAHVTEWEMFIAEQTAIPATNWEDYLIMWTRDKIKEN